MTGTATRAVTAVRTLRNWPALIRETTRKTDLVRYETRAGLLVECRAGSSDVREAIVCLSGREYPAEHVRVPTGATVLDLGANIGAFALLCEHVNRTVPFRGYAVEPYAPTFELLVRNLRLNGFDRFEPCLLAIDESEGDVTLDATNGFDAVRVAARDSGAPGATRVACETLAGFCSRRNITWVDLCKLDVEGAEYRILEHDLAFVHARVGRLLLEYHDHDPPGFEWLERRFGQAFALRELKRGRGSGVVVMERP